MVCLDDVFLFYLIKFPYKIKASPMDQPMYMISKFQGAPVPCQTSVSLNTSFL